MLPKCFCIVIENDAAKLTPGYPRQRVLVRGFPLYACCGHEPNCGSGISVRNSQNLQTSYAKMREVDWDDLPFFGGEQAWRISDEVSASQGLSARG
jgi:hypothetical protein